MAGRKYINLVMLLMIPGIGFSAVNPKWLDKDAVLPKKHRHAFGSFTAGADFIRAGQSQSLIIVPPFSNYYRANTSYTGTASFGLTGGIENVSDENFFWQLGVSGYDDLSVKSSGEIWQFSLPSFNNVAYDYKVNSSRVVATGKLLSTFRQVVHPYLSADIGAAFNRASSYHQTPLIEEAIPDTPFSNQTTTSFTWGVGLGVDVDINSRFRFGVGYQFADLGQAQLGRVDIRYSNQNLNEAHLYTNQLRAQLTVLI